jgi:tRNA (mo5U34)-methyltransferase
MPMTSTNAESDIRERIRAHKQWYHTLELAPGLVTPGWFDTRKVVDLLPLPPSLEGKRCLDIGTFDGFWAFEMERRGAAEVLAIDLLDKQGWDWPVNSPPDVVDALAERKAEGDGFELALEALESRVVRRELSVYMLDQADVGAFDFVYFGSLLLHLQNPVRALERVRSVCNGLLLSVDAIDIGLSIAHPNRPVAELDGFGRPWWWKPNALAHVRMLEAGGFELLQRPRRFFMPPGPGQPRERPTLAKLRNKHGRNAILRSWKGDPHSAILARPVHHFSW